MHRAVSSGSRHNGDFRPCFLFCKEVKMVLGGIQKNSFIDFPGKISAVLFFSGCNFRCPYCHNPELVKNQSACPVFTDEEWILQFLKKRKGFLDGVVISGGEPTIHHGLFKLCRKLKALGYPIKLDTNGSRPEVIRRLIVEGLVDYIAMDIKTDLDHYCSVVHPRFNPKTLLESIQIIMDSGIGYEFRTTCTRPLVNENVIGCISRMIEGSRLYVLQRFRKERVLEPGFFYCNANAFVMSDAELALLQSIAKPWVHSCIVR